MSGIPAHELRRDLRGVLRRVHAGDRLRVTVSGLPVAELLPLPERPSTLPWEAFIEDSAGWRADAQLALDLEAILSDTTDDPRLP